jgi:hypothetical protein
LKANDTSCAGNDLSRSKSLQSFGLNDGSKACPKSPKVMGKTSLRHEVVIRNGDSGKGTVFELVFNDQLMTLQIS